MEYSINFKHFLILSASLFIFAAGSCLSRTPAEKLPEGGRALVFISDTHMGVGRTSSGEWSPYEDFRWNNALKGFLNDLSTTYGDQVQLVILGDFLELWQPGFGVECTSGNNDSGCTEAEMAALAKGVVAAHQGDLRAIDDFLSKGSNALAIVPGNHDAALMIDDVWNVLVSAFVTAGDRLTRVDAGVWASPSGKTVAEHGHQIGSDVNSYARWPKVTVVHKGVSRMIRPWGEQFVQKLFNDVEAEYPIIDNLSPESLGAKYRFADKGPIRSGKDLARFVVFNIFETSRRQKGDVLGTSEGQDRDLAGVRERGHLLVIAALPEDDDFAALIKEDSDVGESIREELTSAINCSAEDAGCLPDTYIQQLCDSAEILEAGRCPLAVLSAAVQSVIHSKQAVMSKHLSAKLGAYGSMINFVYGHTHEYETPWSASFRGGGSVEVANTGAFQRVINSDVFKKIRDAKQLSASETLKSINFADFPACYTFVVIANEAEDMNLYRWHQTENGDGKRVDETDSVCH